jgi:hypothetical protein
MKFRVIAVTLLSLALLGGFSSMVRAEDTPTEADIKEVVVPVGTLGAGAMGAAGGSTVVGAAAATGIGGAVAAGAAGGIVTGIGIEHATGAGSSAGDWLYENSNRKTAGEAVDKFDEASGDWKNGNYVDAVGDGAQGVGKMFQGYVNW